MPALTERRTLLDIGDDVRAFLGLIEEADGEIATEHEEAMNAWFAEVGQEQERKLDGYCALVREFALRAAARKEESERLLMRVRVDENTVKRLKERLKFYMESTGQKKIETPRYKIAVQKNGGKAPVEVTCNPETLPPNLQRVTVEPDLDAIREAVANGEAIAGVRMLPRGTHLRIS